MRLGPGKHLKGLTLMGGLVKPEEFDYFHEVGRSSLVLHVSSYAFTQLIITSEIGRLGTRGYFDGLLAGN